MKTLARLAMAFVVLGLCLPSYGEILVYKGTFGGTYFEQRDGEWQVRNQTSRCYMVIDVDYGDSSIKQGHQMSYQTDKEHGKSFEQGPVDFELVTVLLGTKVQWVIMDKQVDVEGDEIASADFMVLAGATRRRNIGTGANQEVATTLTGYRLSDNIREEGHVFVMLKLSATFYPAWTYWANGDEGNQSFDATNQMITEYLTGKGYTEKNQ